MGGRPLPAEAEALLLAWPGLPSVAWYMVCGEGVRLGPPEGTLLRETCAGACAACQCTRNALLFTDSLSFECQRRRRNAWPVFIVGGKRAEGA